MVHMRYVYAADDKGQGNAVPSFFLGGPHAEMRRSMSELMVWKESLMSGCELSRAPIMGPSTRLGVPVGTSRWTRRACFGATQVVLLQGACNSRSDTCGGQWVRGRSKGKPT